MAPNMGRAAPVVPQTLLGPASPQRGMGQTSFTYGECICERPCRNIMCCVCGYVGMGRVKHTCPRHPKTIFLIDMSQCPVCRAYAMHMAEF